MNQLKVGGLARSPRRGGRMDFVDKMQTRQFSQNKDGRRQAREVREDRKWTVRGGVTEHGERRGLLHLYCCTVTSTGNSTMFTQVFFQSWCKVREGTGTGSWPWHVYASADVFSSERAEICARKTTRDLVVYGRCGELWKAARTARSSPDRSVRCDA